MWRLLFLAHFLFIFYILFYMHFKYFSWFHFLILDVMSDIKNMCSDSSRRFWSILSIKGFCRQESILWDWVGYEQRTEWLYVGFVIFYFWTLGCWEEKMMRDATRSIEEEDDQDASWCGLDIVMWLDWASIDDQIIKLNLNQI